MVPQRSTAIFGILCLFAMPLAAQNQSTKPKPRVVVVGVNGMELDILRPLLLKGQLPNLAEVIKDGAYGKLRTVPAPNCPRVYTTMFTSTKPAVRAGFGRTFIPLDLTPSVTCLKVPTLLIGGKLDLLLPIWHSDALAATLPNLVEYAELPGVGHMAMLEAPDEVTPRIGRLARACLMGTAPPFRWAAVSA